MFAELFILGFLAHLFADWFLQSDKIADLKNSPRNAQFWEHGLHHLILLLLVWDLKYWAVALLVCAFHVYIDTRTPLKWWRAAMKQKQADPQEDAHFNAVAMHVAFWQDQAAHLLILGIASKVITLVYGS